MNVEILYFAILRERVGRERETLDLPAGADVRAARRAVAERHPGIEALLPVVQTAVNRVRATDVTPLAEGDEVALLPPVAGGAGPRKIAIRAEPLVVDETVAAVSGPNRGGVVTFTGVVRREGHHLADVIRLEYEAYVEMAEQVLAEIAEEIEREWVGTEIAIHHRVGSLVGGRDRRRDHGGVGAPRARVRGLPRRHRSPEGTRADLEEGDRPGRRGMARPRALT